MLKNSIMVAEEKNTMVEIKMVLVNLRIFPFSNNFFCAKKKIQFQRKILLFYKLTLFFMLLFSILDLAAIPLILFL